MEANSAIPWVTEEMWKSPSQWTTNKNMDMLAKGRGRPFSPVKTDTFNHQVALFLYS